MKSRVKNPKKVYPIGKMKTIAKRAHGRTEVFICQVEGEDRPYEVTVTKDLVTAVAIDDGNKVWLVQQFRPAWKKDVWVLPGGGVEKKNASENDREVTIRKELRQEIGYDCKKLDKLATVFCSAGIRSKHHIYLATDLFCSPEKPEGYEKLKARRFSLAEAILKAKASPHKQKSRTRTTGYTLLGLLLAKEKLGL